MLQLEKYVSPFAHSVNIPLFWPCEHLVNCLTKFYTVWYFSQHFLSSEVVFISMCAWINQWNKHGLSIVSALFALISKLVDNYSYQSNLQVFVFMRSAIHMTQVFNIFKSSRTLRASQMHSLYSWFALYTVSGRLETLEFLAATSREVNYFKMIFMAEQDIDQNCRIVIEFKKKFSVWDSRLKSTFETFLSLKFGSSLMNNRQEFKKKRLRKLL